MRLSGAARRYAAIWNGARAYASFTFTPENVIWDQEQQLLVITYTRDIEGRCDRACEIVRFDQFGEVAEGEGLYGAASP